eukprot:UN03878
MWKRAINDSSDYSSGYKLLLLMFACGMLLGTIIVCNYVCWRSNREKRVKQKRLMYSKTRIELQGLGTVDSEKLDESSEDNDTTHASEEGVNTYTPGHFTTEDRKRFLDEYRRRTRSHVLQPGAGSNNKMRTEQQPLSPPDSKRRKLITLKRIRPDPRLPKNEDDIQLPIEVPKIENPYIIGDKVMVYSKRIGVWLNAIVKGIKKT